MMNHSTPSIIRWIRGIIYPPEFDSIEKKFRAQIANWLVWGLIGISFYLVGKIYFFNKEPGPIFGIIGLGILGSVVSKKFLNKGDLIKAIDTSTGFLWLMLGIGIWLSPWYFSPLLIGQLFVIILSSFLAMKYHTLGIIILTIGLNFFVNLLQSISPPEYLFEICNYDEWGFILVFSIIAVGLSRLTQKYGIFQDETVSEDARRYQALFERTSDGVFLISQKGVISYVNQLAVEMLRYPMEELIGMEASQLLAIEENFDLKNLRERLLANETIPLIETSLVKSNGGRISVEMNVFLVFSEDDKISHFQAMVRDVSKRKKVEQDLRHMAHHDQLTKLPNRLSFQKAINRASVHHALQEESFAVLFVDLDDFKHVNDTYGHVAGDEVLIFAANLLRNTLRDTDTVARWGGDEFVIILIGIKNDYQAGLVADKLLNKFAVTPIKGLTEMNPNEKIYCSIGISLFPADDEDWGELIDKADRAMYAAKASGKRTYKFYV